MIETVDKLLAKAEQGSMQAANAAIDYASLSNGRELALQVARIAVGFTRNHANTERWMKIYWQALLAAARLGSFDAYMLYLEKQRPLKERFYQPRRAQLRQVVDALQALYDDELDEIFLSMPPRVGKTHLVTQFLCFAIGSRPRSSNLYSAFSDSITSIVYEACKTIMTDARTYTFLEIFPDAKIVATNANDETLDVKVKCTYPSLTCRSISSSMNGSCDADGFEVADDLVEGIEEAMNPDRLARKLYKVENDFVPRGKESCKRIWMGTRWATKDPAGVRMQMLEETHAAVRWESINVPALNEQDESNFDYPYNLGFSTETYRQRRASFEFNSDMASWMAQYQGSPVDREGTLFRVDDLTTYNGTLPEDAPDGVIHACDVAWGGGDYLCSMVGYIYDDTVYVTSIVFDKGDKTVTRPRVARQMLEQGVRRSQFEKNNGGEEYAEDIQKRLEAAGCRVNITCKSAPNDRGKRERIIEKAPDIRRFIWLDAAHRDKDYHGFIQQLLSYQIEGKNKHDDAPDCAAMLATMAYGSPRPRTRVLMRRF